MTNDGDLTQEDVPLEVEVLTVEDMNDWEVPIEDDPNMDETGKL